LGGGDAESCGVCDRLAQQVDQRVADARVRDAPGREKKLQDCLPIRVRWMGVAWRPAASARIIAAERIRKPPDSRQDPVVSGADRRRNGAPSRRCSKVGRLLVVLAPVGDQYGHRRKHCRDDRHGDGRCRRPQPDHVPSQHNQCQTGAHQGEVPPPTPAQTLAVRSAHPAGRDPLVSSHLRHLPTLSVEDAGPQRVR